MSKITKSNAITLKSTKAVLFLFAFLLCSIVTFGQFRIKPNTTFAIKNVVSSKEESNVFDSSILGENEVVLNGDNQFLETAVATSLPTLRIANASELAIRTELNVRGNLIVQSGILNVQKPVHIEGALILENDALIYNEHLIIYKNKFVFSKLGTSPIALESGTSSPAWVLMLREKSFNVGAIQTKPLIISNDFIENQYVIRPFSPPPERMVHA